MHRKFRPVDDSMPAAPQPLLAITATLLPLRQRRLGRLERAQQRLVRTLKQHQQRIEQQQVRLTQAQDAHRASYEALHNLAQTSVKDLRSCLHQERQDAQAILMQQQRLNQLLDEKTQLQRQLDAAAHQLMLRQKALEKLHEMKKVAEGEENESARA